MPASAADELRRRLDEARESPAYAAYERTREHVLRLIDRQATSSSLSDYWAEELLNVGYMFDASPLVIERLRQHCYHITGIWSYNYRTHKDKDRQRHERKLQALLDVGGPELWAPEPPLLGGFGYPVEGGLMNADTLKYFEVLIALDRGAALGAFRSGDRRPVVWEIGAGWGGFAYQFKTAFPGATYVISDLPELMLFSATYLATAFPDAQIRFWDPDEPLDDAGWLAADFVFVPHWATAAVTPPHMDLAVNTVSFQEMTTDQVREYVTQAHRVGCPLLHSLNRERSLYNPELEGVSKIMSEHYAPQEIDVLPVPYGDFSNDPTKPLKRKGPGKVARKPDAYRHLLGWRRAQPVGAATSAAGATSVPTADRASAGASA